MDDQDEFCAAEGTYAMTDATLPNPLAERRKMDARREALRRMGEIEHAYNARAISGETAFRRLRTVFRDLFAVVGE